jgi:hypothetical protein
MIRFITKGNKKVYDFDELQSITKVSRAKLYRIIKENPVEVIRHKNQHFYTTENIFSIMESILIEKLNRSYGYK